MLERALTEVQNAGCEVRAFREKARASRVLLLCDLAAGVVTLPMLWLVYSQIVVMRHHWPDFRCVISKAVPDLRATG